MLTSLLKYATKLLANLDVNKDSKFNWSDVDLILQWVVAHAQTAMSGAEKAAAIAGLINDKWPGRAQWVVDAMVKLVYVIGKVQKVIAKNYESKSPLLCINPHGRINELHAC